MSAYDNSVRRVVLCENVQDASVSAFNDPIEALKLYGKPVKIRVGYFGFENGGA